MTLRRGLVVGWLVWGGLLVLATALLVRERDAIDLAYAVLTMILVVLGGSVAGGRALGFTLAFASFVLIDYYFQQPYDRFAVNKPDDAVVLLAFLATAGVATDLLTRARQEAAAARQRASEVESLSRLGAATLRHARPEAALDALAGLVRETIAAASCSIFRRAVDDPANCGRGFEEIDRLRPASVLIGRDTRLVGPDPFRGHESGALGHTEEFVNS